jgi:2-hydroxy-3-keto-5-methylthiopentenyl-1-phosphate phosphatase
MPLVRTVLVDFDGTACLHDVAEHLLTAFGDSAWPSYDEAWGQGEISRRVAVDSQDRLLLADRETMIEYAAVHCPLDPTFPEFVRWARAGNTDVTLVSDGFGFYIEPILARAGLADLPVITNEQVFGSDGRVSGLRFPNGNAACIGCGTCKMQAVLDARRFGTVAFVGEGSSDRYGALYADIVFAKDTLVAYCRADGVPFVPWSDFDDVRDSLRRDDALPGPVDPSLCPGWRDP